MWCMFMLKLVYDVVIVGGGGYGLVIVYYLVKEYGISNVVVVEKGWLGGGNIVCNIIIVCFNYLWDEFVLFYEYVMKLWEGLFQDFNYNVMFFQCGVYNFCYIFQDMCDGECWVSVNCFNGVDGELLNVQQVVEEIFYLDCSKNICYLIMGVIIQCCGGVVCYDVVVWGFVCVVDVFGVDLIQQIEVIGFCKQDGVVIGVEINCGFIGVCCVGVVIVGNFGYMVRFVGFCLLLELYLLQVLVFELLKLIIDSVIMFNVVYGYISQLDKGDLVIGVGIDGYNGYGQCGFYLVIEYIL